MFRERKIVLEEKDKEKRLSNEVPSKDPKISHKVKQKVRAKGYTQYYISCEKRVYKGPNVRIYQSHSIYRNCSLPMIVICLEGCHGMYCLLLVEFNLLF